jgi:hypothetical protein
MNGDRMRRVKTGDPLKIPANTYNRVLDATEAVEGFGVDNGAIRAKARLGFTEVMVNNASGSALPRFSVVGIDGAGTLAGGAINNEDSGRMMSQPWYLVGVSPSLRYYGGQWAVLKDAAAEGRTARAFWKGLCTVPVWFKPNAAAARWADIPWDTSAGWKGLAAQHSGRARIISKDTSPISGIDLDKLGLADPKLGSVYFCVIDIGEPGLMEILATPTSGSLIDGETDRWELEWSEVIVSGTSYTMPSGLRSHADLGLALNAAEFGNTGSGLQPDGVFVDALPGTYSKREIRQGILLRIRGPYFDGEAGSSGEETPFWISEAVANQYWGACEASSSGV